MNSLPEDLAAAQQVIADLERRNVELEQQVLWFKKQLFGTKSERRSTTTSSEQLHLGEEVQGEVREAPGTTVKEHTRRSSKKQELPDDAGVSGLRFDGTVPIEEEVVPNPAIAGLGPDEYEVLARHETDHLAQRTSYYVKRTIRQVVKVKESGELSEPPAPPAVLERSFADVTFLAGVLIDKFVYHLPLYRIHQRLAASGIFISRATLTNYVHRTIALLVPVYEAQGAAVVRSQVLAMDETPIKAGRKEQGKMGRGYFWPVYGDQDEVIFPYASTRAASIVRQVLGEYSGTLLSDGYAAYKKFAAKTETVTHAQCWAHTRREFVKAQELEPERANKALDYIGQIYDVEELIRQRGVAGEEKFALRVEKSKPVVDEFFDWLRKEQADASLLPKNRFTKAAAYALSRRDSLSVFLADPAVPIDTNHLERALRPIPMGRKNWLFCTTEVGAELVGVVQSLIVTCRLHAINPFDYLVDVLQRVDTHPMREVHLLTPRLWKQHFMAKPAL